MQKRNHKLLKFVTALILTIFVAYNNGYAEKDLIDPLFNEAYALRKEAIVTLKVKGAAQNTVTQKSFKEKVKAFQQKLESASESRTTEATQKAFAKVVEIYLQTQAFFLHHQILTNLSAQDYRKDSVNDLSDLNLRVSTAFARHLQFNADHRIAHRIQHDSKDPTQKAMIVLHANDAMEAELSILKEAAKSGNASGSLAYLKLIQLVSLKQRLNNLRVLDKYNTSSTNVQLNQCGPGLLSAHDSSSWKTYPSLQAQDQFELYANAAIPNLNAILASETLFQKSEIKKISWDILKSTSEFSSLLSGLLPKEIFSLEDSLTLDDTNTAFQEILDLALKSSSFPADDFSPKSTSARIAHYLFESHKKTTKQFIEKIVSTNAKSLSAAEFSAAQATIESTVNQTAAAKKEAFLFSVQSKALNYFNSTEYSQAVQKYKSGLVSKLADRISPQLKDLRTAKNIQAKLPEIVKRKNQDQYSSQLDYLLSRRFYKEALLPVLFSGNHLSKRFTDILPVNFSSWFWEKFESQKSPYFEPIVTQSLKKIQNDERLAKFLYAYHNEALNQVLLLTQAKGRVQNQNIQDIVLTQSELEHSLNQATQNVVGDFYQALTTKPNKPDFQSLAKKNETAPKERSLFEQIYEENNRKFAAPSSTAVAPMMISNVSNTYVESESERNRIFQLAVESLAMVYQGENAAKILKLPVPKLKFSSAGVPFVNNNLDIELLLKHQAKGQFPFSLLDQQILSKLRKDVAYSKAPLLNAPTRVDDDGKETIGDILVQPGSKVEQVLIAGMQKSRGYALQNLNSACAAKPWVKGDKNYRWLFRSAEQERMMILQSDPSLSEREKEAQIFTETFWEKLERQWAIPAAIAGLVFLVVLFVYIGPLVASFLTTMMSGAGVAAAAASSTAATSSFSLAALLTKWSMATATSSLIVQLTLSQTAIFNILNIPIFVNLVSAFNVNYFELSDQVRYQLRDNVAFLGLYAEEQKDQTREILDLKDFAKNVRRAPYYHGFSIALTSVFTVPMWYNSVKPFVQTSSMALKRLEKIAKVVPEESLSNPVVTVGHKTFKELVQESGAVPALYKYLRQSWGNTFRYSQPIALKPNVTTQEVNQLYGKTLYQWMQSEERLYKVLNSRLAQLKDRMAYNLGRASELGLNIHTQTFDRTEATVRFMDLLKGQLLKYGIRGDDWRKLIVDTKLTYIPNPQANGTIYATVNAENQAIVLSSGPSSAGSILISGKEDVALAKGLVHTLMANESVMEYRTLLAMTQRLASAENKAAQAAKSLDGMDDAGKALETMDVFFARLNEQEWVVMNQTMRHLTRQSRWWYGPGKFLKSLISPRFPLKNYYQDLNLAENELKTARQVVDDFDVLFEESAIIQSVNQSLNAKAAKKAQAEFEDFFENQRQPQGSQSYPWSKAQEDAVFDEFMNDGNEFKTFYWGTK